MQKIFKINIIREDSLALHPSCDEDSLALHPSCDEDSLVN